MTKTDIIYQALLRGERLTSALTLTKYDIFACSQEIGRAEKKYSFIADRKTITTYSGVRITEYSMNAETIRLHKSRSVAMSDFEVRAMFP